MLPVAEGSETVKLSVLVRAARWFTCLMATSIPNSGFLPLPNDSEWINSPREDPRWVAGVSHPGVRGFFESALVVVVDRRVR